MRKLNAAGAASIFLLVSACATVDAGRISGTIDAFGIASASSKQVKRANPDAPGDVEIVLDKVVVTKITDRIEARVGSGFGYEVTVTGLPEGNDVRLRKVVKFPPMSLPDGSVSRGFETELGPFAVGAERRVTFFEGYAFDDLFELVEGPWILEIWFEDQLLTTKTFDVVPHR